MRIDVVTIFPGMFEAITRYGVVGRAVDRGLVELALTDLRDFATDRHRSVDDRPYGGGPGMVMLAEPVERAVAAVRERNHPQAQVIYLSPAGRRLDHDGAVELASRPGLILLAGRYAGIDQRAVDRCVDEEWSIGDYVLSGGELAAMVLIEAAMRQLPGVLGNDASAAEDSFADGLLGGAMYTRPERHRGQPVPDVLLSGDHEAIRRWRLIDRLRRTRERRPDLVRGDRLSDEQRELLEEMNLGPARA